MASEEAEVVEGQDIFYVCKKTLMSLKDKLKKGEEITDEAVNELTFPEKLADEEVMIPVDMRGVGEEFEDVEEMVKKLGPKGTAEAFIKARDYFEANKDGEADSDRPKEMTAAEWKAVLAEDDDDLECGEEEDLLDEDEEEDLEGEEEEGDEEGDGEPAAKKAKTDEGRAGATRPPGAGGRRMAAGGRVEADRRPELSQSVRSQ
eukprot:CAMPEP_0170381530 /NCGR_PEP_ID=MMETSP0117_2-20130122/14460_1 /TAXON_ID=400756 /ORGANISM="Durinskia baltica, Strain CSIRO CS-38" /LENGTH=203 /DNA_ID=CAMNT_0010637111 /DNA_START=77 /DNA_END=686 /DNA_ORIENTATION=-